ncbi:hypothetical protein PM082_012234 [Marasmius tenuissimus]|nr:hypothetical protein PM082_012234 [Marasmius tenuissimus]
MGSVIKPNRVEKPRGGVTGIPDGLAKLQSNLQRNQASGVRAGLRSLTKALTSPVLR